MGKKVQCVMCEYFRMKTEDGKDNFYCAANDLESDPIIKNKDWNCSDFSHL